MNDGVGVGTKMKKLKASHFKGSSAPTWAQKPSCVCQGKMFLVKALCFSIVAALDFPQGAPVDWEDGPLPSTRAAWVLVDAKAGQIQLPWQLAECGIAGVAFALCVIFTLLCWRHGLPGQEVDLEAGLGDWDARCAWDARCGRGVRVGREVCKPRSYKRASRSCESSGLECFEDPGLAKSESKSCKLGALGLWTGWA